ncbi:MAG TPA: hypothetical protein VGG72_21115 [Bryobacteraceae bacterium]
MLSKEFHDVSIDQIHVFQVDGNRARFRAYSAAKRAQILFRHSAANGQDSDPIAVDHSVDPATHFQTEKGVLILLLNWTSLMHPRGWRQL